MPSGGVGRSPVRLCVAFEARKEAVDARDPFPPDDHGVEELAERAELQLVLHQLADQGPVPLTHERVAVAEAANRQRALVELEGKRLVRPPVSDALLEPAAWREVASPGRARPLLGG